MRSYLLRSYRQVKGSYGASDLETNLAAETDLTIALRRELAVNAPLRAVLTRTADGVLPMVFQYNPLDYVIETNRSGELVVTVCRAANLSPRIRYNIGDLGHVVRMPELRRALRRHGAMHVLDGSPLDLPVLFHYGRSDAAVDFYGAVVTPDGLRDALYACPSLASRMREFRLIVWEDDGAAGHLTFAVELRPGGNAACDLDESFLGASVTDNLMSRNGDFANACRIAPRDARPRLRVFDAGTGPFEGDMALKYRYVSRIDMAAAEELQLTRRWS
jgi:phenylacetate-CoA ligase